MLFPVRKDDVVKRRTRPAKQASYIFISTTYQTDATGQRRKPQGKGAGVFLKKKVLPRVGGVRTVGTPAPPAYFIKFENGVTHSQREKRKGSKQAVFHSKKQ